VIDRRRTLVVLLLGMVIGWALIRVGGTPALTPRHALPWVERAGPAATAAQLARLTAIAASVYIAAACALALARDVLRLRAPVVPTPRALRRLLGLGVVGALSVPAAAVAAPSTTEAPVLVLVEPAPPATSGAPTAPPTIVQIVPPPTTAPPPTATPATATPPTAPPVTTEVAAASTWMVQRGDHFWSIAERVVSSRGGDARDDGAVGRYWRSLVAANRDRLAVADDPDMIFPGQQLVLPPVDQALTR
jgi:hypothetical protein